VFLLLSRTLTSAVPRLGWRVPFWPVPCWCCGLYVRLRLRKRGFERSRARGERDACPSWRGREIPRQLVWEPWAHHHLRRVLLMTVFAWLGTASLGIDRRHS